MEEIINMTQYSCSRAALHVFAILLTGFLIAAYVNNFKKGWLFIVIGLALIIMNVANVYVLFKMYEWKQVNINNLKVPCVIKTFEPDVVQVAPTESQISYYTLNKETDEWKMDVTLYLMPEEFKEYMLYKHNIKDKRRI